MDLSNILIHHNNEYVLYDDRKEKVIGYGNVVHKNGYIIIDKIATEKGYGALLHDFIIMDNFPREVRSDDELTDKEIKIWKYYFSNRNEVIKSKIPYNLLSTKIIDYDEEALLNSYRLQSSMWFNNLKYMSESIIKLYRLNTLDIVRNGEYFFNEKYGEYFV